MAPPRAVNTESKLLSLPAELRNNIYERLLLQEEPVKLGDKKTALKPPALLQTCQQIRAEASKIYHMNNIFHTTWRHGLQRFWFRGPITTSFIADSTLMPWLHSRDTETRKALRRVYLDDGEDDPDLSPYLVGNEDRDLVYDCSDDAAEALEHYHRQIAGQGLGLDNCDFFISLHFDLVLDAHSVYTQEMCWLIDPVGVVADVVKDFQTAWEEPHGSESDDEF